MEGASLRLPRRDEKRKAVAHHDAIRPLVDHAGQANAQVAAGSALFGAGAETKQRAWRAARRSGAFPTRLMRLAWPRSGASGGGDGAHTAAPSA